jgi:hypothetical protein
MTRTYDRISKLNEAELDKERKHAELERDLWRDLFCLRTLLIPALIGGAWLILPPLGGVVAGLFGISSIGLAGLHMIGRHDLHCVDKVRKERRTAAAAAEASAKAAAAETSRHLEEIDKLGRDFQSGAQRPVAVRTLRLKAGRNLAAEI